MLAVLMLSTILESAAVAGAQIFQSHEKMWHSLLFISLPRDVCLIALA